MGEIIQKRMKWKANTNGFNKNPQNILWKWRPRKWISLVNEQLANEWYEPAKKQDIESTYLQMLQLEEKAIQKMVWDRTKPMLVRILAKNMLSVRWFDIIETMLDRSIWKATQKTENENINTELVVRVWLPEE
jgi:hypothetical protein